MEIKIQRKTRTVNNLTKEFIIDKLKEFSVNGNITANSFHRKTGINPKLVVNKFGSWNNAIVSAGLSINRAGTRFTKEEKKKDLELVCEKLGVPYITYSEYQLHGNFNSCLKDAGKWDDVMADYGFTNEMKELRIRQDIQHEISVLKNSGYKPTLSDYINSYGGYSYSNIYYLFGSFENAVANRVGCYLGDIIDDGSDDIPKNIYYIYNKYRISFSTKNKLFCFGTYQTLLDAKRAKDILTKELNIKK